MIFVARDGGVYFGGAYTVRCYGVGAEAVVAVTTTPHKNTLASTHRRAFGTAALKHAE